MRYDQTKALEDEKFRRLTGVKLPTFLKIVDILRQADIQKKSQGGRKNEFKYRGTVTNDIGVLKRILYVFSYWSKLRD